MSAIFYYNVFYAFYDFAKTVGPNLEVRNGLGSAKNTYE
jgi:hypothetical protein